MIIISVGYGRFILYLILVLRLPTCFGVHRFRAADTRKLHVTPNFFVSCVSIR